MLVVHNCRDFEYKKGMPVAVVASFYVVTIIMMIVPELLPPFADPWMVISLGKRKGK